MLTLSSRRKRIIELTNLRFHMVQLILFMMNPLISETLSHLVSILNKFEDKDLDANDIFERRNIGAIHILYIRGEGQKIQRNGNASKLEKF